MNDDPDIEAFGRLVAEDPERAAAIFDVFAACDPTWIDGNKIAALSQGRLDRRVTADDVHRLLRAASTWRSRMLCDQLCTGGIPRGHWKLFKDDRAEIVRRGALPWLRERAAEPAWSAP